MTLEQQNKQLQGELALANKVIEKMAEDLLLEFPNYGTVDKIIKENKAQVKQELISLTK